MANLQQRKTKILEKDNSDASIRSADRNRLVREAKTSKGYWVSDTVRQFDQFKIRESAKKWFDQERTTQIALGKVRGFDAEVNEA